jgi:hypothetical protein
MSEFADQLDVFFGEATPAQARVYARLGGDRWPTETKLEGTLRGPTCLYAQTLPATYSFQSQAPGESKIARATVPDPCFWTPQLPYLYEATLQLRSGGQGIAQASRTLGIRPLGIRGASFFYAGKRWVLRGAKATPSATDVQSWHDAEAAMWISVATDAVCRGASNTGVLLVVNADQVEIEIKMLAQYAAVGMIVADGSRLSTVFSQLPSNSNCILLQDISKDPKVPVDPRAQAVIVEASYLLATDSAWKQIQLPVVAYRDAGSLAADEIRSACDQLQADLAPVGDFAGYFV